MNMMYCWRCKIEVPMLDEDEFAIVDRLYSEGMRATKAFRQQYQLPLEHCSLEERFRPLREAYKQMTNWEEMNANAIMHHRIAVWPTVSPMWKTTPDTASIFLC